MKRRIEIALSVILIIAACGCGKEELPSDTPWNSGYGAVMETESGYYSNNFYRQGLLFHDKGTGVEILLCAKPECQHAGEDTCVATYHNMPIVNSVLYDGAIYILSREYENDIASFNLYRASLNGSALDKVGEVFSAKNNLGRECSYTDVLGGAFIIHKGYAYIPIYLAFSRTEKGFVNGGLMKMDIRTGETEQIYTAEFYTAAEPENLRGCGDYVYFDLVGGSRREGTYRYHIKDGTIESAFGELGVQNDMFAVAVTEKRLYVLTRSPGGKLGVGAFDSKTSEYLGTLFYLEPEEKCPAEGQGVQWLEAVEGQDEIACYSRVGMPRKAFWKAAAYEDRIFFMGEERLLIYSDQGEKLGQIEYGMDDTYPSGQLWLKISDGKVYALHRSRPQDDEGILERERKGIQLFDVYSCPIQEIEDGRGSWTFAYTSFYEYRDLELNQYDFSYENGFKAYSDWSAYALGYGRFWE